jgi:hypothetical protein
MFATRLWPCLLLLSWTASARAQTIDDGMMMPARSLFTGVAYGHDGWDRYWEGTLKRENGNVGSVTTQSVTWSGTYGITDRLNVVAQLPYVWTRASQGTLAGQSGLQDVTVALKYRLLETEFTGAGSLRALLVASAGTPVTDYVPDLFPLSIGMASSRASGRATLMFSSKPGWFAHATGAYTWRGKVTLDRPAYFTDGQLHLSDEVVMPDVFDYTVAAGYMKPGLMVPLSFSQQITRGGGDIRRQDAPFVSNRMNVSRVDASVMYTLPRARPLAVRVAGAYAVRGRNVGQSTALTAALLYTFTF